MTNQAVVMTDIGKMEIREVPVPQVASGCVLIEVEYVGICGSDLHYLEFGKIGDFVVEGDFILGHECGGRVVALGEGVTTLKVGDAVALEPGATCGKCRFCKEGKYNLCPDVQFLATPPYQGCLMKYMAHPADLCFPLPPTMSTKEGALIEPLAVGMHAAAQGGVSVGDRVVILGAGCIGLMTLLACKARGATDIVVVDVMDKRLQFAQRLGASTVINASKEDVILTVGRLFEEMGADVVLEAAGNQVTTKQTVSLVKRGGTIVLVGMTPENLIEYDIAKLLAKEATIKTVFRYRNLYPRAIAAVAKGNIDISEIATHEFPFEDTPEAFLYAIHNKNEVVKGVIKIK
ncbi:MAG: NAD(P)-dependent alcohol dehydrogenase [Lachnospiraceae bacterium]|nr:NAD(P)-dependent alcohol dehydrogenase [Lachnospiraceae bacterium]